MTNDEIIAALKSWPQFQQHLRHLERENRVLQVVAREGEAKARQAAVAEARGVPVHRHGAVLHANGSRTPYGSATFGPFPKPDPSDRTVESRRHWRATLQMRVEY